MNEPVPTITLPPLAHAVDVAVLEDWLAIAAPGDEIVYAWGLAPPRQLAAWGRARELSDEGEVRLHDRRRQDGKGRDWYMVKRAVAVGDAAPIASAPVGDGEESDVAKVLRNLRRHVNLALPCPTNGELGTRCGLTTRQAAYQVELLVKAGTIRLEQQGPMLRRILTIGGKSTPAGAL